VGRQFLKSGRVSIKKRRVIKPFGDDVHDGQREGKRRIPAGSAGLHPIAPLLPFFAHQS
jgi:hypothetical protein